MNQTDQINQIDRIDETDQRNTELALPGTKDFILEVISGTMPSSTDELKTFAIGWLGFNDNEQWHGPLAQLLIFDKALSAQEVLILYKVVAIKSDS